MPVHVQFGSFARDLIASGQALLTFAVGDSGGTKQALAVRGPAQEIQARQA
jgi:hypothetical protein